MMQSAKISNWVTFSDGIRPVHKSLFLEFLYSREPVVGLSQKFSIFAMNTSYLQLILANLS